MNSLPTLSVIIVTKNNMRTLPRLLKNIAEQNYPKEKIEIIVIDGKSSDGTQELIKNNKQKIRFKIGKIPNDPETCKGEGLALAKGELVALIDSDNYLPHKNWLSLMVKPLVENKDIVGSYTWRFAYKKNENLWNRYFSLIGSADPVGLYLGKADKFSYISDKWMGFGKLLSESRNYMVVELSKERFPTLGSNGFFARRKYLLKGKADINHFFHIDVPFDLLDLGLNKYAIVKDEVIHDTAIRFFPYLVKRAKYMQLHYQKRSKVRRYKVYDPQNDNSRLILFIICSLTFLQPLYISVKGYLKVRDRAWFIHPIFCFAILITYGVSVSGKIVKGFFKK